MALSSHPDRLFAEYVWNGLANGFRVGFDRRVASSPRARRRNSLSVKENPLMVDYYIREEVEAEQLIGPMVIGMCHSSPVGLIPNRTSLMSGDLL